MAVISTSLLEARGVPLGVVAALALALSACQATPPQLPQGRDGVVPSYNADTGRLERISYDLNKDG